ncbi:TPA: DUF968 domain-containing protein [Escherichia coli]
MRALLTPEIAPRMGIVLFRPGSELMPLFMQGRVLLEPEPERYSSFASGAVPAASQPLADDPAVRAVFRNEAVIRRAGGVECLESWLLREKGCQWPHSDWHSENMTTMRHAPGAIRLCWHCDNQLRDQFTERLESMATDNCARWVLSVVRRDLGFDDSHVMTMPELCWWLVRNDLADALPESAARKALRLPKPVVPSVTRESDLVPLVPATSIIQDKAKKVLALKVDPESPESFMLRPKRRRWVNEKYLILQDWFIGAVTRPMYRAWLKQAVASGVIRLPRDLDRSSLYTAVYSGPVMPWIDPVKEAEAWKIQIRGGAATESDWVRAGGRNPDDVKRRRKAEIDENRKLDLVFDTDPASDKGGSSAATKRQ